MVHAGHLVRAGGQRHALGHDGPPERSGRRRVLHDAVRCVRPSDRRCRERLYGSRTDVPSRSRDERLQRTGFGSGDVRLPGAQRLRGVVHRPPVRRLLAGSSLRRDDLGPVHRELCGRTRDVPDGFVALPGTRILAAHGHVELRPGRRRFRQPGHLHREHDERRGPDDLRMDLRRRRHWDRCDIHAQLHGNGPIQRGRHSHRFLGEDGDEHG